MSKSIRRRLSAAGFYIVMGAPIAWGTAILIVMAIAIWCRYE